MSIPSVDLADFLSGDPIKKNDFVHFGCIETEEFSNIGI